MKYFQFLLFVSSVAVAGCSGDRTGGTSNSGCTECGAGEVCVNGECTKLCDSNADCGDGQVCTTENLCRVIEGGVPPVIEDVIGNHATDPTQLVDGMVVTGTGLGDVSIELVSTETVELAIRNQSTTAVQVILPADVVSGDYTLVASNGAGTDQASVTLTLPELTGDVLLDRINTDATGTVAFARLPVGTAANTVAQGDHNHDAAYYTRAQADSTFVTPATLPVTTSGGNYIPNPSFDRGSDGLDSWDVEASGAVGRFSRVDVSTDGVAGVWAVENDEASRVLVTSQERVPIDRGAQYLVVGSFRNVASAGVDGKVSLGVRLWDSAGTELLDGSDWWIYAEKEVEPGATWQRYSVTFGAGAAQDFPPEARTMTVAVWLNENSGNAGTQRHQVQGLGIFDRSRRNPFTFGCIAPNSVADGNEVTACTAQVVLERPSLVVGHINGYGRQSNGGWCMYSIVFPGERIYYPRSGEGTRVFDDLHEAQHSYSHNYWEAVSQTRSRILPAGTHDISFAVAEGDTGVCDFGGSSLTGFVIPF